MFRRQRAGRWRRSCPVGTCSPAARVLRRHVFSVGTRPPSARVLCRHASSVNQRLGAAFAFSAHTPTRSQHPGSNLSPGRRFFSPLYTQRDLFEPLFTRPRSQHVRTRTSLPGRRFHSLHHLLPRSSPFSGVAFPLRQSGADTPPPLVIVTGHFLYPLATALPFSSLAPNHRKTFLCPEFWRETLADCEPRHGLRGEMSRHGARLLASAV